MLITAVMSGRNETVSGSRRHKNNAFLARKAGPCRSQEGGRGSMATAQLVAQDVFAYLRPEQINAVNNASEVIECRAGTVVYSRGAKANYMYAVLTGHVALRFPGKAGVSIFIEELLRGAMFGTSTMFDHSYMLTAQCVTDCRLLKINTTALRRVMEEDLLIGFAIQKHISELYFKRYIDAMQKLGAIVMSLPLEAR
jgi:CRP-like cAMP-binding protein